jgi:hypothetical protein
MTALRLELVDSLYIDRDFHQMLPRRRVRMALDRS